MPSGIYERKSKKVKVVCQYCGNGFKTKPSHIKNGRGKYCSRKCYYLSKDKKITGVCQQCGKEFKTYSFVAKRGQGKYCSCQCYNLARTGKHIWENRKPPFLGKHHSTEAKWKIGKAQRGNLGEKHPCWRGGISFEPYTPSFNQQLKDRIRVRDNFICQLCGVPELECNTRLSIHHIDYDKKNCDISNLITLCRSCNTRVNADRKFWTECFKEKVNNGVLCMFDRTN